MIFTETELRDAFLIDLEPRTDDRGFFARVWCRREFEEHGLSTKLVQCNVNYNAMAGTLRGMHFQRQPRAEAKLVRCTRGAIYDVIIDLRPESPTYMRWLGAELTEENRRMLYVPEGFAHGYQTLIAGTEAFYQVSEYYTPEAEGGVRWDDPAFGISWPDAEQRIISAKDQAWPNYQPARVAERSTGS
jgi:dTDP-4-dehydrorhamnose 3,5-epimerase